MFRTSSNWRQSARSLSYWRARYRPGSERLEERALLSTLMVDPTNSADYQTISAAVTAAKAGDTIKVAPGTYDEEVTVNKPLTILGAEAGVNAASRAGSSANESIVDGAKLSNGDRSTAFYITANDVTINGFTVENTTSPNNLGAGIDLGAGTFGSKVYDNIFNNNVVGLLLANNSSTDPTIIRGNLFENNNQAGPSSGTGIYSDQYVSGGNLTNVLITGNKFTGNSSGAVTLAASVSGAQSNIHINGNQSVGDGSFASLFNTSGSQVIGNQVQGSTGVASILVGAGNTSLVIAGNSIKGSAGDGIDVDSSVDSQYGYSGINSNMLIGFNNVQGSTGSGISIAKDSLQNSAIVLNSSTNNTVDGIRIDTGNSGNLVLGNNLQGNKNYDAEDLSTGSGTAGTANTWVFNHGSTSNPAGLLQSNQHGKGHHGQGNDNDDNGGGQNSQGDDDGQGDNDQGNGNGHGKHGH
jgi:hypothetical protein